MNDRAPAIRIEDLLAERAWVRRMARALVHDDASALDLEQEAWYRILRRPPAGPLPSVRGWLARVLRNTRIDLLRAEGRRRRREERAARSERLPSTAEVVARADLLCTVVNELMALEEPYRTTLLLRYVEELGPAAIAVRLGLPVETVRTRLRRGLATLRARLDGKHGGDRRAWALLLIPFRPRPAPAAAGGAAVAGLGGALLMGAKVKAAIAAAVLLASTGAFLLWNSGGTTGVGGASTAPRPPLPDLAAVPAAPPHAEIGLVASPAGRAVVEVRLLDMEGRPVAGAEVSLHPESAARAISFLHQRSRVASPTGRAYGASAESDGRALLEGVAVGRWVLLVRAAGYAREARSLTVERGRSPDPMVVLLQRSCGLAGSLRTRDNAPVPGVEVLLSPPWDARTAGFSHLSCMTDSRGLWRMEGLTPGLLEIRLRLPSGTVQEMGSVLLPGPERLDLVLEDGARMEGRVLDAATGAPLEGASVVAWVTAGGSPFRSTYPTALSNPDGTFVLRDLPAGSLCTVSAEKEGFLANAFSPPPSERPPLEDGVPYRLDLPLERGVVVRGRITDTAGTPLPGSSVTILLEGQDGDTSPRTEADTEGRYLLRTRGGKRALFFVGDDLHHHPDQPPWSAQALQKGLAPESLVVELPESGEVIRDFALPAGAVVEGRVVDRDGNPLAGAMLHAGPTGFQSGGVAEPTGLDGDYRLEGVRTGTGVTVTAFVPGPGGRWGKSDPFDLPEGGKATGITVVVVDHPGSSLAGRVTAPDGSAVGGARLWLLQGSPEGRPGMNFWESGKWHGGMTPVAADGSFRFEEVRSGTVTLLAEAPGFGPSRGPTLQLEPGEQREEVSVRLAPESRLEGRILDGEGVPVEGAEVVVAEETWGPTYLMAIRGVSGADGKFAVGGLADIEYQVIVSAPGLLPARLRARPGGQPLALVLESLGSIGGVALDGATGESVAGVPVRAAGQFGDRWSSGRALTRSDGTFTVTGLLDGPHEVTAGDQEGDGIFVPVQRSGVATGTRDLRLSLRRGLALAGRLVDEEGRPAALAMRLFARPVPPGQGRQGRSLPDGTFRLGGLEPGTYDILVDPDPYQGDSNQAGLYAPTRLEGVAAGTENLEVRLHRGLPIAGFLVDEAGGRWKGKGTLTIVPRGEGGDKATTVPVGMWGEFNTPALRTGRTYDIVAERGDFSGTAGARVEGVAPGATGVKVVLTVGRSIAGRVLLADGSAAPAGVVVRAWRTGEDPNAVSMAARAVTGSDGRFTLGGLEDREYIVAAGGEGGEFAAGAAESPVRPDQGEAGVRVAPGVVLEGRLLDGDGKPVKVQLLMARQSVPVPTLVQAWPGDDGKFRLGGLAEGRVRISVFLEGGERDLGEFGAPAAGVEVVVR